MFGGTQFNTMGVAASVDVIFETFGRILFEQGGIEKIERLFNLGVASSLLDERVKEGQVPTLYPNRRWNKPCYRVDCDGWPDWSERHHEPEHR